MPAEPSVARPIAEGRPVRVLEGWILTSTGIALCFSGGARRTVGMVWRKGLTLTPLAGPARERLTTL